MNVLIQNGKTIPITDDMALEEELLTKKSLEDMYQGNMNAYGKIEKVICGISIGMLALFCLLPVIVMLIVGMSFADVLPILGFMVLFVVITLLVHGLSSKSIKNKYKAIVEGRFRLLYDTINEKYQMTNRDSDSHVSTHHYYIKGVNHPEFRQMFITWWKVSQVGDPVYFLEIANKRGKYSHCEVFPAKLFKIDPELKTYVERQSMEYDNFMR